MHDEDGFGLLEALVAFFLVSSALAGFVTLVSTSSQLLQRAEANHLKHEQVVSTMNATSVDGSRTADAALDLNITPLVGANGLALVQIGSSDRDGSEPLIYVRPIEDADQ